jgi:hypothetical protein
MTALSNELATAFTQARAAHDPYYRAVALPQLRQRDR